MNKNELKKSLILLFFSTFIEKKKCIWKTDFWRHIVAHGFSEAAIEGILQK